MQPDSLEGTDGQKVPMEDVRIHFLALMSYHFEALDISPLLTHIYCKDY